MSIAWSPDGSRLAVFTGGTVHVINFPLMSEDPISEQFRLGADNLFVGEALAFSADGRYLAAGYATGEIRVADLTANTVVRLQNAHTDAVRAIDFSSQGDMMVSVSGRSFVDESQNPADTTMKMWDLTNLNMATGIAPIRLNYSFPTPLLDVAFTPDGSQFAVVGEAALWVYDATTAALLYSQAVSLNDMAEFAFVSGVPQNFGNGFTFAFLNNRVAQGVVNGQNRADLFLSDPQFVINNVVFSQAPQPGGAVLYAASTAEIGATPPPPVTSITLRTNTSPTPLFRTLATALDMTFNPAGTLLAVVNPDRLTFYGVPA